MKQYISVDVETSGPVPGKYSMISLGACLVDDLSVTFYREIKPISPAFVKEGMHIACAGLKCLEEYRKNSMNKEILNPKSEKFNPRLAMNVLDKEGDFPIEAMKDFKKWILKNTTKPVIAAAPIIFDGMFINWYFHTFLGKNPFGYSGEDINSMYRGLRQDINESIKNLNLRQGELTHNALEDAVQQAKEFKHFLDIIRAN